MYHLAKSLYLHATSLPEYSILLLGLDAAGKTTLLSQIRNIYGVASGAGAAAAGGGSKGEGLPSESAGRTVPTVGQNVCTIQLPTHYLRLWDIGGQQSLRSLWPSYFSSCHAIVFVVDSTDVGDADLTHLPNTNITSNNRGFARSSHHPSATSMNANSTSAVNNTNDEAEGYGRLGECAEVLSAVLADASTAGVPLLVLANKQDREDSVEVVRIKEGFVRRVVEGEAGASGGFGNSTSGGGVGGKPGLERKDSVPGGVGDGVGGNGNARQVVGGGGGAYVRDSRVLPCSALNGQGVKEAVDWISTRVGWNREARPPVMR